MLQFMRLAIALTTRGYPPSCYCSEEETEFTLEWSMGDWAPSIETENDTLLLHSVNLKTEEVLYEVVKLNDDSLASVIRFLEKQNQ